MDWGYLLELPRWGSSNKYPQSMFWTKIWKISEFSSENGQFLLVKFSIYLNGHVFLMIGKKQEKSVEISKPIFLKN